MCVVRSSMYPVHMIFSIYRFRAVVSFQSTQHLKCKLECHLVVGLLYLPDFTVRFVIVKKQNQTNPKLFYSHGHWSEIQLLQPYVWEWNKIGRILKFPIMSDELLVSAAIQLNRWDPLTPLLGFLTPPPWQGLTRTMVKTRNANGGHISMINQPTL